RHRQSPRPRGYITRSRAQPRNRIGVSTLSLGWILASRKDDKRRVSCFFRQEPVSFTLLMADSSLIQTFALSFSNWLMCKCTPQTIDDDPLSLCALEKITARGGAQLVGLPAKPD